MFLFLITYEHLSLPPHSLLLLIDEAAFKDENGIRISIFIPLVFVFTKNMEIGREGRGCILSVFAGSRFKPE